MAQPQVPVQTQAPNGGAGGAPAVAAGSGSQFPTTSLYVGDLETNVLDSQLFDLFSQVGHVVSVRVCRDINTRRSLGYAYVNFSNPVDAARSLDMLNFTPLNNKPIRIMYSNRDPSMRRSGAANIFIKNLDKSIDNKALYDTFSAFGNILSCKVATDASGQSKGYGFVQFEEDQAAQNAISKLNGMLINDNKVYVGPFLRKQERESSVDKSKFKNVFVKNLSESTTKDDLLKTFAKYGTITSAIVMTDGDGKSKCFGFVNFDDPDSAAQAVEELNGQKFDDKDWYVGRAQKKSERELELKGRFEQSAKEAVDKYQGLNLYLKNLDDSIGDEKLKELFESYGTIASCKVMRDPNGISRGSGFVAFSSPEEAAKAIDPFMSKMIHLKDIVPAATNTVNTKFILLEKGSLTQDANHMTCLALVADETASVHFQMWGTECEAFESGDIIRLTNGIFSYHKNNLVLRAGKKGNARKVGEFNLLFVETPNMSEIRWARDPNNPKNFVQEAVISSHSRIFAPMQ